MKPWNLVQIYRTLRIRSFSTEIFRAGGGLHVRRRDHVQPFSIVRYRADESVLYIRNIWGAIDDESGATGSRTHGWRCVGGRTGQASPEDEPPFLEPGNTTAAAAAAAVLTRFIAQHYIYYSSVQSLLLYCYETHWRWSLLFLLLVMLRTIKAQYLFSVYACFTLTFHVLVISFSFHYRHFYCWLSMVVLTSVTRNYSRLTSTCWSTVKDIVHHSGRWRKERVFTSVPVIARFRGRRTRSAMGMRCSRGVCSRLLPKAASHKSRVGWRELD
jgi:hypothetical protein